MSLPIISPWAKFSPLGQSVKIKLPRPQVVSSTEEKRQRRFKASVKRKPTPTAVATVANKKSQQSRKKGPASPAVSKAKQSAPSYKKKLRKPNHRAMGSGKKPRVDHARKHGVANSRFEPAIFYKGVRVDPDEYWEATSPLIDMMREMEKEPKYAGMPSVADEAELLRLQKYVDASFEAIEWSQTKARLTGTCVWENLEAGTGKRYEGPGGRINAVLAGLYEKDIPASPAVSRAQNPSEEQFLPFDMVMDLCHGCWGNSLVGLPRPYKRDLRRDAHRIPKTPSQRERRVLIDAAKAKHQAWLKIKAVLDTVPKRPVEVAKSVKPTFNLYGWIDQQNALQEQGGMSVLDMSTKAIPKIRDFWARKAAQTKAVVSQLKQKKIHRIPFERDPSLLEALHELLKQMEERRRKTTKVPSKYTLPTMAEYFGCGNAPTLIRARKAHNVGLVGIETNPGPVCTVNVPVHWWKNTTMAARKAIVVGVSAYTGQSGWDFFDVPMDRAIIRRFYADGKVEWLDIKRRWWPDESDAHVKVLVDDTVYNADHSITEKGRLFMSRSPYAWFNAAQSKETKYPGACKFSKPDMQDVEIQKIAGDFTDGDWSSWFSLLQSYQTKLATLKSSLYSKEQRIKLLEGPIESRKYCAHKHSDFASGPACRGNCDCHLTSEPYKWPLIKTGAIIRSDDVSPFPQITIRTNAWERWFYKLVKREYFPDHIPTSAKIPVMPNNGTGVSAECERKFAERAIKISALPSPSSLLVPTVRPSTASELAETVELMRRLPPVSEIPGVTIVEPAMQFIKTCCAEVTTRDTIVGETKFAWVTIAPKGQRQWCYSWISKKHQTQSIYLPFLAGRGSAFNASFPFHAHGLIFETCKDQANQTDLIVGPGFYKLDLVAWTKALDSNDHACCKRGLEGCLTNKRSDGSPMGFNHNGHYGDYTDTDQCSKCISQTRFVRSVDLSASKGHRRRYDALHDDHRITRLRNFDQNQDVRSLSATYLHGVHLDLTKPGPGVMTTHIFEDVVKALTPLLTDELYISVGNRLWSLELSPVPVINFTSGHKTLKVMKQDKEILVQLPLSGKHTQIFRFAPVYAIKRGTKVCIVNGVEKGLELFEYPNPNLPFPQTIARGFHPLYAGMVWLDYNVAVQSRSDFERVNQGWADVYGVDENLFSQYQPHVKVVGEWREFTHAAMDMNIKVTFYNSHWTKQFEVSRFTADMVLFFSRKSQAISPRERFKLYQLKQQHESALESRFRNNYTLGHQSPRDGHLVTRILVSLPVYIKAIVKGRTLPILLCLALLPSAFAKHAPVLRSFADQNITEPAIYMAHKIPSYIDGVSTNAPQFVNWAKENVINQMSVQYINVTNVYGKMATSWTFLSVWITASSAILNVLSITCSTLQEVGLVAISWMMASITLFLAWYNLWGYKYQGVVPSILEDHPLFTISGNDTPATSEDLSEALCIVTYGTRGDHIPMQYFGRLAALVGVRTHNYQAHLGDNRTLAQLRRADFSGLRLRYIELLTTTLLPYKNIFQPFVHLGGKVTSYSLSPSRAYIDDLNFGGNPTWFSKFAAFANRFFLPDYYVGSLKDCLLPRSPDGRKLLKKLGPVSSTKEAYTHGSEDPSVIPEVVKRYCEKLPSGDHQVTMRDYSGIYSHAGAGTLQTILMSGLTLERHHICDDNIDRLYHTLPTRDDLMERSPYVFIGHLILKGFKVNLSMKERILAVGINLAATTGAGRCVKVMANLYKVYALYYAFNTLLHHVALVLLSFPAIIALFGLKWLQIPLFEIFKALWEFPILTVINPIHTLGYMTYKYTQVAQRVIKEVANWQDTRTELVMTSNQGFPAPFGHAYVVDHRTGRRYEGQFLANKGWHHKFAWVAKSGFFNNTEVEDRQFYQTLYMYLTATLFIATSGIFIGFVHPLLGLTMVVVSLFLFTYVICEPIYAFSKHGSTMKIRDEYRIPLPFTSNSVERMAERYLHNENIGGYHPFFNCQSLVVPLACENSFFLAGFITLIYLFTLTVLIPGWAAKMLRPVMRQFNIRFMDVSLEDILADIANGTDFAAAAPENHSQEEGSKTATGTHDAFVCRQEYYKSCGLKDEDLPKSEKEEQQLVDKWSKAGDDLFNILEQVQSLYKLSMDPSQAHPLSEAEADHVRAMTIAKYLENHKVAEEIEMPKGATSIIHDVQPNSQNDPTSPNANMWAKFVGKLDEFLSIWSGEKYVADVISWLRNQRFKHYGDFTYRLYHLLCFVGRIVYITSFAAWVVLNEGVGCFLQSLFPIEEAKRLKSAWAFAGLTKTPFISTKRRFQESITWTSKEPRGDFIESFTDMVDEINHYCERHGAPGIQLHPQYRKVNTGKPVLDDEQATLLGLKEGEYVTDTKSSEFTKSLRDQGAPISADTVYLTEKIEYIQQSVQRYVPKYDPISPEDKMLAHEIANMFGERFPENFKDAKTLTPRQVQAYYKAKYAPGSPWISVYKTRQALEDAGITAALFEMVEDRLAAGKYPDMFHKAFVKSQVVNIEKVINGNKNVRTVVAEELLTYFMNMCMELERNHRHNWKVTGMGIGMPMNQSMISLYNTLMQSKKEEGGMYAIADAHEYDSKTAPFAWEFLAKTAEIGYPGKPQASVLRAKYDALQSSFIFQETMPNHHNSASVIVPTVTFAEKMMRQQPAKFITASLLHKAFPRVSQEDLYDPAHPVHSLYANKVVLATDQNELTYEDDSGRMRYRLLSPIFIKAFIGDAPTGLNVPFQSFSSETKLSSWLTDNVSPNIHLLYNAAQKNRGGGTGENATSWDNGWGFKAAFIATWVRYNECMGRIVTPADFFKEGNVLFNTGDDSAIKLSNVDSKTFNKQLWLDCALHYGLELDFDFTDDIKDVEYLGNAIRRPNSADTKMLLAWQKMMTNVQRSRKEEIAPPPLPRFLVYHKERDSFIRLSSRRYYQNQPGNLSFVHHNMQKFAGTATIAVFNPTLWNVLATEYCSDAERLARHYNVPGFRISINKDQFGLDQITYSSSSNARRGSTLRKHIREYPRYRPTKQEEFFVFMEGAKFPSQAKSIRDALDLKTELPVVAQQLSFMQKLDRKSGNLLETTNFVVDYLSEELAAIPRFMYKMTANILPATGEPAFASANYPVEHFVAKCEAPESEGFMLGKLARSPWASVTNGSDFYRHYQDTEFRENHDKHTKEAYGSRLILGLILYCLFYFLENYLVRIPVFGTFIRIFYAAMIDLPKVYGVVSCLYWSYYGDNSPIISALMPKDIFIWGKRFAMFIASNLPMFLFDFPFSPFYYLYHLLAFIVVPIEQLCQLIVSGKQMSEHPGSKETAAPFENPWDREVRTEEGRFQVQMRQTADLVLPPVGAGLSPQVIEKVPKPFVVKSAVGSGKSSLFPYALLNNARWIEGFEHLNTPNGGRVVLALPRTILRDKWNSPFQNDRQPHQLLKQGVHINPKAKILIGTDGHLLNRVRSGELTSNDIYLLDEFHELNGQKVALFQELLLRRCKVMLPSATPKPIPGITLGLMEAAIPRRFAPDIWPISDSISPADALRQFGPNFVTQWPLSGPPNAEAFKDRVLIKCTHINGRNGVNETLEILQYDGWVCHVLTSETSRDPIPDSAQVVIATDIINTGISLPGFKLLVYDGKMHAVHQGEHKVTWTDPDTKHQGMARVGRYGPGDVVLCPVSAGTGSVPQVYPAMSYLAWSMNAQAHDLPELADLKEHASPTVKRNYVNTKLTPYIGISKDLPAFMLNAVSIYHAIANSGTRQNEIRATYNKIINNKPVDEAFELIVNFATANSRNAIPYDAVMMAMSQYPVIYVCRNLTDKTQLPSATVLDAELKANAPELYNTYYAQTRTPLVPYKGRLRPFEETESKINNDFLISADTNPSQIYEELIEQNEAKVRCADDVLSSIYNAVAGFKSKSSGDKEVSRLRNSIIKTINIKKKELEASTSVADTKREKLTYELQESAKVAPTLTYTTIGGIQYIHNHQGKCPICREKNAHQHVGYNGCEGTTFDQRDQWFDRVVETDSFILFHHGTKEGRTVASSKSLIAAKTKHSHAAKKENRPAVLAARKEKRKAAKLALNPKAQAFQPASSATGWKSS